MLVANTILQQLGGKKFMFMTGSKDFVGAEDSLMFRVGQNPKGWNKVKITLNGKDLYDMTFYRIRKLEIKEQATEADVYAEDLQRLFTENTGLYTRL